VRVVVTGATGFIGSALVPHLRARGDKVTVLTRDAARARELLGDVNAVTAGLETPGPWAQELAGAGAIVHLAGEPVAAKRWDARQKQVIRDSRVEATRVLVEALEQLAAADRPKALIVASGTDYYPYTLDKASFDDDEVTESDPAGDSFLARVCRDWEREANAATAFGVRVACMRTGLALGPGGALAKLTTPFKLFLGGKIGSGRQWVSWIHRDDCVAAYLAATVDERYTGPINLVTESVRNRDFSRAIGAALGKPSWLPVPKLAVRIAAGEFADSVLQGRRVVPARLKALGFTWRHPELAEALRDALG